MKNNKTFMQLFRMYNEIKTARLKDIEKLTYALNIFSVDTTHPIYDKIIEEITSRLSNDKTEIFKQVLFKTILLSFIKIGFKCRQAVMFFL